MPGKKMKARGGKLMTDRFLVEALAVEHPWLSFVYQRTSGYVHFSRTHIVNCIGSRGTSDPRDFQIALHQVDSFIDDEIYIEAIDAFAHLTQIILQYCRGWACTKNLRQTLPQEVTDAV